MIKIHLLSDLHVEFYKGSNARENYLNALVQPADVLVLAGDIHTGRTNVLDVIKRLARHYEHVLYCPGNHEYYGGLELNGLNIFTEFAGKLPSNAHLLNPGVKVINDVTFIGGSLFTNFHEDPHAEFAALRGIVDFRRIPDATIAKYKELYYYHSQFFKLQYEQRTTEKVVFFSHWMPDVSLAHPKWGGSTSVLNKYFGGDLGEWIASLDNAHWLFGHTHDHRDELIGTLRCLAAPLGYPGENAEPYRPLILEL